MNKKFEKIVSELPLTAKKKILEMNDHEKSEKILALMDVLMHSEVKSFVGSNIEKSTILFPESIVESSINYGNIWEYLNSLKYNNVVVPDGEYILKYISSVNTKSISDYKVKPKFTYKFFDKGFYKNTSYYLNSIEEIYNKYIEIVNSSINELDFEKNSVNFYNEKISEIFEKLFASVGNSLGSNRDLNDCYFLDIGNNINILGGEEDLFILWMLSANFNHINAESINNIFIDYIEKSVDKFEELYGEFYQDYYSSFSSELNSINTAISFIEVNEENGNLFKNIGRVNSAFNELIENRGFDFSSMALGNALLKTYQLLVDEIFETIENTPVNKLSTVKYYEFIVSLAEFFGLQNDSKIKTIEDFLVRLYADCLTFREFYIKFIQKFRSKDVENKFISNVFKSNEEV